MNVCCRLTFPNDKHWQRSALHPQVSQSFTMPDDVVFSTYFVSENNWSWQIVDIKPELLTNKRWSTMNFPQRQTPKLNNITQLKLPSHSVPPRCCTCSSHVGGSTCTERRSASLPHSSLLLLWREREWGGGLTHSRGTTNMGVGESTFMSRCCVETISALMIYPTQLCQICRL